MKIINPKLENDLTEGQPVRLDLGGGRHPKAGFYSLDLAEMEGVDAVVDLNQPLDLLPDDCAEAIYSRHTLEHVHAYLPLMSEIYRITRSGGSIEIIVPHFSNVYGFSDPTHVRFFGLYSMYYFASPEHQPKNRLVPDFYSQAKFRVKSIKIEFYKAGLFDKLVGSAMNRLVNLSFGTQTFYERRLSALYHAWQIRFLMEPEK